MFWIGADVRLVYGVIRFVGCSSHCLDSSILLKYACAHSGEQATFFHRNMVLSFSQSAQGVNCLPHILHGFCILFVICNLLANGGVQKDDLCTPCHFAAF